VGSGGWAATACRLLREHGTGQQPGALDPELKENRSLK
jgi:hypothetical protein